MEFLEKVMDAISMEIKKQDSLYSVSDIEIKKMAELNNALKKIENEILSIPAKLELNDSLSSEINAIKNKDSLKILVGYQKAMDDYFISCEDTTSEEYEYFENAYSVNEAINMIAEMIGKFIKRAEIIKTLPECVLKAREYANVCYADSHKAWNKLNEIALPSMQEYEEWQEVKKKYEHAHEEFENKLLHYLNSGSNA